MASSRELYEIYVWSMDTGNLLDVLTGHSSVVSSISCFESMLASVSLDKTMRLWNVVEGSGAESVQLLNEGLDVKHSPCGHLLAVLCYDACISLFNSGSLIEIGTIETRLDIDAGRESKDRIKKSTSERNKSFTCIAFSPDSLFLLAGGQSNTFCLYSVADRILLRIFKLTANISLDGVLLDVDYRKMSEFGNMELFDLSGSDEDEDRDRKRLKLPGTKQSDLSERSARPSINISQMRFSPTGRNFAVVSTEGVSIYSLDERRRFDPFQLETDITPERILSLLSEHEFTSAVCLVLRLNDVKLIRHVVESLPHVQLKLVVQNLTIIYAEKLLRWIGANESLTMKHLHFYQLLIHELFFCYAAELKSNIQQTQPIIIAIQQSLNNQSNLLARMSNQNKHTLDYLLAARKLNAIKQEEHEGMS